MVRVDDKVERILDMCEEISNLLDGDYQGNGGLFVFGMGEDGKGKTTHAGPMGSEEEITAALITAVHNVPAIRRAVVAAAKNYTEFGFPDFMKVPHTVHAVTPEQVERLRSSFDKYMSFPNGGAGTVLPNGDAMFINEATEVDKFDIEELAKGYGGSREKVELLYNSKKGLAVTRTALGDKKAHDIAQELTAKALVGFHVNNPSKVYLSKSEWKNVVPPRDWAEDLGNPGRRVDSEMLKGCIQAFILKYNAEPAVVRALERNGCKNVKELDYFKKYNLVLQMRHEFGTLSYTGLIPQAIAFWLDNMAAHLNSLNNFT